MKKIMVLIVAMAFIAFGYAASVSAAGADKSDKSMNQKTSDASYLIGKDVKDMEGKDLGEIKDFVRDGDEISLAIVSHGGFMGMGGKDVAVPYSALAFNESEDHFVLNATEDQLANAPEVVGEENLNDRAFAEEVYRHFGERPYWTDKDAGAGTREYYGSDEGIDSELEPGAGAGMESDTFNDSDTFNEDRGSVEDNL